MMREVFGQYGATMIGIVTMLLCVAIFMLIIYRTYRPGSRETYAEIARLPLDTPAQVESNNERA